MKKQILVAVLVILAVVSFSGCTSEKKYADDGKVHQYSLQELTENEKEGFFVLNENEKFTPIIDYAEGYNEYIDENTGTNPSRYIWWTDNSKDVSTLIPTINNKTKIVAIYNKNSTLPENITLEKYKDMGYTIGAHMYKDEANDIYISTVDYETDSNIAQQLMNLEDNYKVYEINESDKLPTDNIDNNICMLLGLEKDAKYLVSIYVGTSYRVLETTADTRCLQAENLIPLDSPYEQTKEGYFIVKLPDNLENGYYYLSGAGLFRYKN